jgi:anaerobic magnesium-protoporphyrin IX monomethyl ester cyclase
MHGPGLPLVWGGWHPTLFPEQTAASDLADFVVAGDGETALLAIADYLTGKTAIRPGPVVKTPFVDLNNLPPPRFEVLPDLEDFLTRPLSDKFLEYHRGRFRWLPYQTSRGCPYSCAFCINPTTGNRKYRARAPLTAAREMADLARRHRLTHIKIIDDNLFVQRERVRAMFEEVEHLGVPFTWDAECRIDYFRQGFVDDNMLAFLKRTGLIQLTFGIESGSPDTLKRMRKGSGFSPEHAVNAVAMAHKHGIVVRGSFILDIPGDTVADIKQTVGLIRKLRRFPKFSCGVHTYRPYPKSSLCEEILRKGRFHQPDTLEAWEDDATIRQFTDTTVVRHWQDNYRLSSRVSFFQSLESGFWLKQHQLPSRILGIANRIFIALAKIRNRTQIYALPLEKPLYIVFKDWCLRRFRHGRHASEDCT